MLLKIKIQERCQNMPWIFNDQEATYIETTKIDGTSSTYVLEKQKFPVVTQPVLKMIEIFPYISLVAKTKYTKYIKTPIKQHKIKK